MLTSWHSWCGRSVHSSAVLEVELPFPVRKILQCRHQETAFMRLSCRHAWTDRFYRYCGNLLPVQSVRPVHCFVTPLLKAFLVDDTSNLNRIWLSPVTLKETNSMSHKVGQRRCSTLMIIVLTCDYLTALVILATASVQPSCRRLYSCRQPLPALPASHA